MAQKTSAVEKYLLEHISIPAYFNKHLVDKSKGIHELNELVGTSTVCPFHDDVNPSFRYWKAKNLFVCFGCGCSGDVINLHRLTLQRNTGRKVSRKKAVEDLCRIYNIQVVTTPVAPVNAPEGTTAEDNSTGGVIQEKSPFDRAREALDLSTALVQNRKEFTFLTFKQRNDQIKNNRNLDFEQRFRDYDALDLDACIAVNVSDDNLRALQSISLSDIDAAI